MLIQEESKRINYYVIIKMKYEPVLETRDCILTGDNGYLLLDVKSVQLVAYHSVLPLINSLPSGLQIIR